MNDKLDFVPWQRVADWKCIRCGDCCRLYSVVIDFHEWLWIVKSFGVENTSSGLDKLFIRRRSDGSCAFLNSGTYSDSCTLQCMKPKACQLWPFKISARPKYGYASDALFAFGGKDLYVYADPMCHGLRLGTPTAEFAGHTVREFVEIAAGLRTHQLKTTSSIGPSGFGNYLPFYV